MEIKYLYGHMWAVEEGKEDEKPNWSLEDAVFLTRKTDVFQHADMRSKVGIGVLWGGFAKRFRKPDDIHFYGESVSCGVETPEEGEGLERLKKAYFEGEFWKTEIKGHGNTAHTVFALVPKGYYPTGKWMEINWEKSSHAEMREIIEAEAKAACGW